MSQHRSFTRKPRSGRRLSFKRGVPLEVTPNPFPRGSIENPIRPRNLKAKPNSPRARVEAQMARDAHAKLGAKLASAAKGA